MSKKSNSTKILVSCSMFLAIGLLLRNASYMVYMGGGAGMRLGISGFFTKMPALLFGPVYGGIVSGLIDLFGYILKPDGAYIFPITFVAVFGGVLTGLIFKCLKKFSIKIITRIYLVFVALLGVVGLFNHLTVLFHPNGVWGEALLSLNKKTVYFTYGFYVASLLGFLFYGVNRLLEKRNKNAYIGEYMKIFVTLLIADLTVTTINTFILIDWIPALAKLPFLSFYLPRLAQEIVSVFITSYVTSYLYGLYKKMKL